MGISRKQDPNSKIIIRTKFLTYPKSLNAARAHKAGMGLSHRNAEVVTPSQEAHAVPPELSATESSEIWDVEGQPHEKPKEAERPECVTDELAPNHAEKQQ